jgi:hypothetical protein
MDISQLHFELLIATQLLGGWPVFLFYGPETMTKNFQIYRPFFQKRDPQAREQRFRQ